LRFLIGQHCLPISLDQKTEKPDTAPNRQRARQYYAEALGLLS
jgi:hypothetical protein